jgi:hypothetical protein
LIAQVRKPAGGIKKVNGLTGAATVPCPFFRSAINPLDGSPADMVLDFAATRGITLSDGKAAPFFILAASLSWNPFSRRKEACRDFVFR